MKLKSSFGYATTIFYDLMLRQTLPWQLLQQCLKTHNAKLLLHQTEMVWILWVVPSEIKVLCVLKDQSDTFLCNKTTSYWLCFEWNVRHKTIVVRCKIPNIPLQKHPTLSMFWRHTLHCRFFLKLFSLKMWGSPFPPCTQTHTRMHAHTQRKAEIICQTQQQL